MIRHTFHSIFIAAVVLIVSNLSFAFNGGDGTAEDPYQIATADQLVSIGSNAGLLDKCYILTSDIDLSGYEFTTAVIAPDVDDATGGFQGSAFTGSFDGDGKRILNLTIDTRSDDDSTNDNNSYLGLFGCLSSPCEVKNLVVENAIINSWTKSVIISILSGQNGKYSAFDGGIINNCSVSGSIKGSRYLGGLVGHNVDGTVSSCNSDCIITGLGSGWGLGGLVGDNNGIIINSYSTGSISFDHPFFTAVGGLVGASASSGVISNCFSSSEIFAPYISDKIGGLVGWCNGSTVTNCYATGNVNGDDIVGGLIGYNSNGNISNCYSTGIVYRSRTGGLVGENEGSVINSFWDMESSGKITSAGGEGKLTHEIIQTSNFIDAGWDFSDEDGDPADWQEVTGAAPILAWQDLISVPDVTGLTEDEAKDTLSTAGLMAGEIELYYSNTVDAGMIISQSVQAGDTLPTGFDVDLVVSLGAAAREYRIETPQDLIALANNPDNYDKHYILMNDIDMAGYIFDKAVIASGNYVGGGGGFDSVPFSGIFDGNGHVISNITIDTVTGDCLGLFGFIEETGVVKDLGIENIQITGEAANYYAGGLAGLNYGTVRNCYATGSITLGYVPRYIGGLLGYSSGYKAVECCYTDINIFIPYSENSEYIGGLAGIGRNLINCYSKGYVSGRKYVGGLTGSAYLIKNCYSTATVKGDVSVGGLAGIVSKDGALINCYSTGDVSGNSGVGGLLGGIWDGGPCNMINCYSTSTVKGSNSTGPLAGNISEDSGVINCFWDMEATGMTTSIIGDGKTTAEMMTLSTFTDAGWSFVQDYGQAASWREADEWYPVLSWQSVVEIPDLSGLTVQQAKEALGFKGLEIGGVSFIKSDSVLPGLVVSQSPQSGKFVPEDFEVSMSISVGEGYYETGEGTEAEPWQIDTAEELIYLGITSDDYDNHFVLMSDIEMGEYVFDAALIGPATDFTGQSDDIPFTGSFDGNGFKIINLMIDTKHNGDPDSYDNNCLGLFGKIEGASITGLGIEGVNIQGRLNNGWVGALAAYAKDSIISECYSIGNIRGSDQMGGLIGGNEGSPIDRCYSACFISGEYSSQNIGGFVGFSSNGNITNCYATGSITAEFGSDIVGGFAGFSSGTLLNCYSTVAVPKDIGGTRVDGFIGKGGNAVNCFYDIQTSGYSGSLEGIGKTTVEMQSLLTFVDAGWDFDGDWWINDGRDYPRLAWQPFGDVNNDSSVNITDLAILSSNWTRSINDVGVDKRCELSGDSLIGIEDLAVMIDMWLGGPQFGD